MIRSIDGRGAVSGVVLALAITAAILPGLVRLPPVDRDESRFARGARETMALAPREWLLPRLDGRPRLDKPPLAAWTQMAAVALAGDRGARPPSIVPHRLPSLFAAIAAALATWRLGLRFLPPRAAWLAGALFAFTPVVLWEGAQARADLLLVAATTAALALLAPALLDETPRPLPFARALAGWGALGLALLAKGPVALLVVLPPLLFAPPRGERLRRLAALRPIAGVATIAILGAPWLLAVSRADLGSALAATAWTELPGRFLVPREGHSGFPGVHLVLAPLLAWPGSLGLPLAVLAVARALRAGERSARLLAFWVVPSWIVFELSATRLPHYTLPLLPALALGAAAALDRAERDARVSPLSSGRLVAALAILWRWGSLLAPLALVIALAAGLGPAAWAVAGLFAAVALALHVATHAAWRARRPLAPLAGALATACLGTTLLVGYLLPAHRELWLGPRVGVALAERDARDRPLAAAGWCEESVLFVTGGAIERIPVGGAGRWLEQNPSGLLVHETDDTVAPGRELERFEGFDYVRGRSRSLAISTGR